MANFGGDDIDKVITGGIVFSGGAKKTSGNSNAKVKTKAKKKAYITGAHGSGSAKMKAEIRRRVRRLGRVRGKIPAARQAQRKGACQKYGYESLHICPPLSGLYLGIFDTPYIIYKHL